MNTKNIAIIGANSILGQAIYERLVDDHTVYQVYNANVTNIKSHKNLIQIEDFLKSNLSFDVIYFISAVITFEETSTKINQLFFTNVNLLKTISETFATSKIINASSVAVFQESNHTLIETSPLLPKSSYALSKLWAEHLVATHQGGGVNIRISSLYGVGMKKNTFLPKMMQSAIQNKKIIIFGDGSRKQNYISAKEAADYFCDAMHYAGSMPLLAVGKQSYSNLEMANMLVEMQSEVKIELEGQDNSSSFTYDNTLTKQELRSNQDYSFYELIKEVLEWMQKQY